MPEGRRLFARMSVEENLEIGCYRGEARRARGETLDRVYGLFPIWKTRRRQLAGSLSGGQQQMLAIGRALMVAGGAPAVLREQTRIQEAYLGLRDGGRPS